MKLISAIIRETKLDEVREALTHADIQRITVVRVSGHGQQIKEEIHRGKKVVPSLIPKVKIEIATRSDNLDRIVEAITRVASTGKIGDGKIFVYDLEQIVRIRTGELDEEAI